MQHRLALPTSISTKYGRRFLWLVLFLFPLAVSAVGSGELSPAAYPLLRQAQNIVAGRGIVFDAAISGTAVSLGSPLFVAFLLLAEWVGIPLHAAAAMFSGLGWGATAVILCALGRVYKRPFGAALAAILLVINPITLATLGAPHSWILAFICLSLFIAVKETADGAMRVWQQTAVLALLLLTQFNPPIIPVVFLLCAVSVRERRAASGFILALVGAGWGLVMWRWGLPWPPMFFDLANVTAVALPFLAAIGSDWLARWLIASKRSRLPGKQLALALVMVIGLPLALIQASALWQQYRLRPLARQQLEQKAALWLRQNSPEAASLVASPRLAYLADRPLVYDGRLVEPTTLPPMLNDLLMHPPDYFITFRSLGWKYLTQTGWFQERYHMAQQFPSPYDVGAPLVVWQRSPASFDQNAPTPINVRSEKGVNLVSYQVEPRRIQPGEAVHVQLDWQSDQSPPYLHTVVRLVTPYDRVVWAQRDMDMPRTLPPEWIEPATIFPERFVLTTTMDIPIGAYLVTASLYEPRDQEFLMLYQDEDTHALDRVTLGYVVVPWNGAAPETAVPLNARFDDQIKLLSCDCVETAVPGQTISLRLFWAALRPPDDNYAAFIHLLNADGQYIAGHDAPPFGGAYDTAAWQPGDIIPDEHTLTLPPDLPTGTYTVRVGLYHPVSGVRLPAVDGQGVSQPDQTIQLPSIQVGVQNN